MKQYWFKSYKFEYGRFPALRQGWEDGGINQGIQKVPQKKKRNENLTTSLKNFKFA